MILRRFNYLFGKNASQIKKRVFAFTFAQHENILRVQKGCKKFEFQIRLGTYANGQI